MLFGPICALFSVHHNLSSAWYFNFELPIDKIAPSRKIMKEKTICYGLVHLNVHMPPKAKRVVLGSSFWQTVPPHPLIFSTKILCWPFSRVFVLFCFVFCLFVCFWRHHVRTICFPIASLTVYGDMPVDWFCSKPSQAESSFSILLFRFVTQCNTYRGNFGLKYTAEFPSCY